MYDLDFYETDSVYDSEYMTLAGEWEDAWNDVPWDFASHEDVLGCVEVKIRDKYNVNMRDKNNRTPLLLAAKYNHEGALACIMTVDKNLEVMDYDGKTALMYCAENGSEASVKLLLSSFVEVDTMDPCGKTALFLSVENNHPEVARILMNMHPNLDVQDQYKGDTALMKAVENEDIQLVGDLINAGASLNLRNYNGETALLKATAIGKKFIMRKLLEAGADMNIKDIKGKTPMTVAVEMEDWELVEELERYIPKEKQQDSSIEKLCNHKTICPVMAALTRQRTS